MAERNGNNLTRLLGAAAGGDAIATERVFPLVYEELRGLAGALLKREAPGLTLQPTALVNEAYLKLVGPEPVAWNSRAHFFGAAARAMRLILIDRARRVQAGRRAGAAREAMLPAFEGGTGNTSEDMLALDECMNELRARDERQHEIVMLRFFGGLSIEATAHAMELSTSTVKNEWAYARAWLMREIERRRAT